MTWFRLYHDLLHDDKVQSLPLELFKAWVNLLCMASMADDRGHIPGPKRVAFALRVSEDRATKILGQLTAYGLLEEDDRGGYQPHNWVARQRKSDDAGARSRQHRKQPALVASRASAALQDANGSATRTTAKRVSSALRGPERASDSETDTEKEQQPPLPPVSGGAAAAADFASLSPEAEKAIAEAYDRFDDEVIDLIRLKAATIESQLGGRFGAFFDAFDAALSQDPAVRDPVAWAIARVKARAERPSPFAGKTARPVPAGPPIPTEQESRDCPHCSGMGQVPVYREPDPVRRIPGTVAADCVCPRGRMIRATRDGETLKRVPDLADVQAGQSAWKTEPPASNGAVA